ncbi:MAG: hypothetical protein R3358_04010, partial [Woeseiaceae bacterium]|nr:hypothetical protein [Woeseiaceae bacterium]
MALDDNIIELINADIDGEITSDDKAELARVLERNAEARVMHEQLSALCESLDSEAQLDPPTHLRHVIMNQVPEKTVEPESESWLHALFVTPAVRYAATFAAGVIMTILILDSGQIEQTRFDDMTRLVGTVSDTSEYGPAVATMTVNKAQVAGQVALRRADPIMILDFNLATSGPVDIVASYTDRTVWFNGFAQLEATGTSISADDGEIRIQVNGKRRYAVFLH